MLYFWIVNHTQKFEECVKEKKINALEKNYTHSYKHVT